MMVFLVLELMPLLDEVFWLAARTAVDVPVVTATDVDELVCVVRLPPTVITVVKTTMLLDDEVNSDVDVIEEVLLVVFETEEEVVGVLEGVEDGVELVEDGVEEVVGGVDEGLLLGVLLGVADVEGVEVVVVAGGVDDVDEDCDDVELTEELVCDCEAFGSRPLVVLAETELSLF